MMTRARTVAGIFLLTLCASAVAAPVAFAQSGDFLSVEHKTLPDDMFRHRGGGSGSGGSGQVEKPIELVNACKSAVRLRVLYRDKAGHHEITTSLDAGQSGSTGMSALKVTRGQCSLAQGGVCYASVSNKASRILVTACK